MNLFCTLMLLLAGASEPRSVELYKRDVPKTSGTGSFISAIYTDLSHLRPEAKDKRMPRGTKDARAEPRGQESPLSYSYPVHHEPSDYLITPKTAKLYNTTVNLDGDRGEVRQGTKGAGNGSSTEKGKPNIHNSLYPVTDSSYSAYAVMFLSLIVFAVGVVGNLAVMCIVWHNYYMKSAWNCILASLAFWDFLVLFFCLPVVIFNEITKKRLLGDISCRVVPYLEVTSLGVTTFSLCALVIDRFYAATSIRPKPQPVEPCSSILAKLGVVWIGSMILAIPELLLWQLSREDFSVAPGGTADACYMKPSPSLPESVYSLILTYHDARTWWFFGCYLCLPVLFTVSCQLVTHRIVAGAGRRQESRLPPVSPKQKHHQGLRGQRLDTTVVALAVVYTLCTLPGNISSIALASSSIQVSAPTLAQLALMNQLFLFSKSSMTPVLLLCLCRALGQSFMHCCCCCCEECLLNGSSSSSPSTPSSASNLKPSAGTPSPVFFNNTRNSSSILVIGTPC